MGRKVLKVFLASPSNLEDERLIVHKVVKRINQTIGMKLESRLQLITWEYSIYSDIGEDAQDVINKQVDDDYEIFIGMFWNSIGSPTSRSISGTVEEYERALEKHAFNPSTIIMLYFKNSNCLDSANCQSNEIDELKKKVGRDGVYYYIFSDQTEFENMIFDQLSMLIVDYPKRTDRPKFIAKDYILKDKELFFDTKKEACALAIIYRNKVLLTQRSQKLRVGASLWQLPGGKLEKDETSLDAVMREIKEELGLTLYQNEIKYVTNINSKSLGDDNKTPITLHLFVYEAITKIENFVLEDSIQKVKWVSLSQISTLSNECLGSTFDLLFLVRRYIFSYLPLKTIIDYLDGSNGRCLPTKLGKYSEETSQVLFSLLDVLGFIDNKNISIPQSDDTVTLNKVLLEWCLTDKSIFESNGHSNWQTNMLLLNSGEQLLDYQKTLFEKHASLSALLSYKLSKVLSHRNVCDILVFGTIMKKPYMLMRWDYFAQKFQIPSKGLEKLGNIEKSNKRIAEFVIHERLSGEIISAFQYQYIDSFSTTHLSAGSMDDIKLIRNYDIHLYLLNIKKEMAKNVVESIYSQNSRAKEIIKNANLSKDAHKEIMSFIWVRFDELMQNRYLYKNKRVQGFAEIVDFIGEDEMVRLSSQAIDLTPYAEYLEINPKD